MPSLQASLIGFYLRLRRATINWNAPVERFRSYKKLSERFIKPHQNAAFQPVVAAGVAAEWVIPCNIFSKSVILYLHGGGWTLGWYNDNRRMLSHICRASATRALAVDYRLAPEHPFPAALEDCLSAYRWLLKHGVQACDIVIAGNSAGGNLTLSTLMALRDAGDQLPAAAVCISPLTDLEGTGESFKKNKDAGLTAQLVLSMARHYAGNKNLSSPLLSPHYGDLRGLPPLLIQVGENEILLSDAIRLRDKACAAGVKVNLVVWPKMWHDWHLFVPMLPEAQHAINDIGRFIAASVRRSYGVI